jgi:endonuclease G
MERTERLKRLHAMLKQVAPKNAVEELPRPAVAESSLESLTPDSGVESGIRKLAENRLNDLTDHEQFALEAIVLPKTRPVVFVRGNSYDDIPAPWDSLNPADVKAGISKLLPAIGRIELPLSPLIPYGGTGFIVGNGRLMTNRHVAALFSQGLGNRIKYQTGGAAVDFKHQIDTPESDHSTLLTVRGVELVHPFWDMAILNVDGLPDANMLKLSVKSPEEMLDRDVVVIGYPARDDRNDLALQDKIFDAKYYVKRLQPGKIQVRSKIRSFENMVNAVTHDASTLGGNSGSAVIDVKTGEVVALHFGGVYLKANYGVPMYELARDRRVAPLLNFDGQLTPTNDFDPAWRAADGAENPARTPDVAPQPAPMFTPPPVAPVVAAASSTASWTIPLHITVSIGSPTVADTMAVPVLASAPAAEEVETEKVEVNQDYSDRRGYDPDFLEQVSVALPTLSTKAMQDDTAIVQPDARVHGDSFELAYHNYSVYMNKRRRTAWFSAANVDGDNRPNIGPRTGDRWYIDPRITRVEQLGQEAFELGIDRGHLTRREDTAWGPDVESAKASNDDTFHFANCSLQASAFNRGKDRWQGLEQFLLEQHAKKDKRRMIVITGPLFAASDPAYKNDKMNYTVRCPLQFWKVCVLIREADGKPSSTAFILGQEEIKDLDGFQEAFDVAATQIKVADLEQKTGLDFGDLKEHDRFADGTTGVLEGIPGSTSATSEGRVICSNSDITV